MSDVYQPAYLQDDRDVQAGVDTYNDKSLPMWQRVGLEKPPVEVAPSGRLRVTVSPPKANYQPAYLNPDQQPAFLSGNAPVPGSSAWLTDIPTEIAAAFNAGKNQFMANQPFAQDVTKPSLTAPAAAVGGIAEMAASPLVGTYRSVIGHPLADVVGDLGGRLDNNVAGPPETSQQRYEEAKGKADTAMLLAGVANRVPGASSGYALSPAAQTAEAIGAPLPRGIASNNRAINSATSASASIPLFGARIRNAVDATREAAGDVIGQSGVDAAITANRGAIDNLYNTVRNSINPDQVMPMPQTASAVAAVRARRVAARQANPDQGLEQFENIGAQGASFNGAHRARVDARDAGDSLSPHPGYNAADYNQITRAMTGDIRVNVSRHGGQAALDAFDRAERNFGPISEANRFLSRIARQRGPGAGLDEIGFNPATGQFSLDKFVTAWNKINPQARPFVPEPAHRANIDAVFEMGQHIKSTMRERNTSHTAAPLIMWDLARDAIMTGAAVAGGFVSGLSVVGSGAAAMPAVVFAHWLSRPATAASMARWSRLFQAAQSSPINTQRLAQFNIATRNLANNLGVNVNAITQAVQRYLPTSAQEQQQQQPRAQ